MPGKVKKAKAEPAATKTPKADAARAELESERDRLLAELAPHRKLHDAHVNDPKFLKAKQEIKRINAELFPVMNELGALARAAGSKSLNREGE